MGLLTCAPGGIVWYASGPPCGGNVEPSRNSTACASVGIPPRIMSAIDGRPPCAMPPPIAVIPLMVVTPIQ